MACGEGKGKSRGDAEAIAIGCAGCWGIYCIVCFFLIGIPMLIGGIILIRFAAGDFDEAYEDSLRDCRLKYRDNYLTDEYAPSDDDCGTMREWEDAKDDMETAGIVLIVISLVILVCAIILIVLMLLGLCKKSIRTVRVKGYDKRVLAYHVDPDMSTYPYLENGGTYPRPIQPVYIQPSSTL